MIGPSGGTGIPDLHFVLWVATWCVLGLAGVVIVWRWVRGRRPVMGRSVRVLGVVAAVVFGWYLVDTTDRRLVQGDFDDLADAMELHTVPGFRGGGVDESRFTCVSTGRTESMLESSGPIDRPEGVVGPSGFADEVFELFELLARRAEGDGWDVRRFVDEGNAVRIYGQRGETGFVVGTFTTGLAFVRVTRDECLQGNLLGRSTTHPGPQERWVEVDVFTQ